MNIFDIIQLKYPNIDGFSYWFKQYDGSDWKDPYDGIVWKNNTIPKPSKADIAAWQNDPTITQQYTFRQNAIANAPILAQLAIIDLKSIRALREPSSASTTLLNNLTSQANALRAQLLPTS